MDKLNATVLSLILSGAIDRYQALDIVESARVDAENRKPGFHNGNTGYSGMLEVMRLVQGGEKIPAIKEFRTHFNCGLKLAKDACEALADKLPKGY